MVILLYGPDAYSKFQKLQQLRQSVLERNLGIAQGSFDLNEEGDVYALHEFAAVTGLFSQGKRVATVRNAVSFFGNDVFGHIVSRASENKDVVLLLNEDRDKKLERKEEAFCKKHNVQIQYFTKPTEASVRKRVMDHAAELGITIDAKALAFLMEAYNGDLYAIITDVEKWSAVTKKIDVSFLSTSGEYASRVGLFDFSQSILYRKPLEERLALFERAVSQGIDLYAVFNVVAKITSSKELIHALAAVDLRIKRGLIDIDQAMTTIVLR